MDQPRFAVASRVIGCLLVVASFVCGLWALVLQFHFEPTDEAVYQTEVGRSLLGLVWLGIPLGIGAAVARRRAAGIALVAVGVAVVGFVVTRATLDLDPEAGERRVAAEFAPPSGAVAVTGDPWRGYSFPDLSLAWEVPASGEDEVCSEAAARMEDWSERSLRRHEHEDGCFFAGVRDDHDGTLSVRTDFDDPTRTEVVLTVTRRV